MERDAGAEGKGGRGDPAPPQPGEKAAAAAAGRKGAQRRGESKRAPATGRPASPEGEGAPATAKGGAGSNGRKASSKKREGASAPPGADLVAELPADPPGKPRASRAKRECGGKEPGPGRTGAAAPHGSAGQEAHPGPPAEASPPPEKETARAGGGRGRRGGQAKKDGGDVPGKGAKRQEAAEQRGALNGRDAKGTEGAAAREGAPARASRAAAEEPEGEGLRRVPPRPAPEREPHILKRVLDRLRLAKEERSAAAQRVNCLRDRLVTAVRKTPCFSSVEILGTGSYYERVKIRSPNEFDIMLKVPKLRVELKSCEADSSCGAFYYVKLKRNPANSELKQFCDADEQLSSSRMLSELRSIIIEEAKKIDDMKVSPERKKPGCPAVTLLIGSGPSVISVDIILGLEIHYSKWCVGSENDQGIDEWLGTKAKKFLRSESVYLVPKNVKDGTKFLDNTWRLSFSKIEKTILHNHGHEKTCCERKGVKCCRKDCLKLLKYLLEQLKTKHENRNQFDKFYSYQVKTAFFHVCCKWPKDSDWHAANLDECFERLLNYFLDCLKEAKLPHFFIPTFNLFSEKKIERTKRYALVKAIERERNNRFPVFLS